MSNTSQRSIPIIKLYQTLIVSIQVEVTDHLVLELKEDIGAAIREQDVRGLIIEVSGVDVFDSYIARSIRDIAQISSLMGVDTVLAGLDAGMAVTLVEMGMMLDNVRTALNLESALELFGRDAIGERPDEEWMLEMLLTEGTRAEYGDDDI
jgi:rsbT antagonist protein RsbS